MKQMRGGRGTDIPWPGRKKEGKAGDPHNPEPLFLGIRDGGDELKQPTENASKKELMRAGSSTAKIRHTLSAPRLGEKSKKAARTRTVGLLVGVRFAHTRTRNKLQGQFSHPTGG